MSPFFNWMDILKDLEAGTYPAIGNEPPGNRPGGGDAGAA